jgi:hypothetical protein
LLKASGTLSVGIKAHCTAENGYYRSCAFVPMGGVSNGEQRLSGYVLLLIAGGSLYFVSILRKHLPTGFPIFL